MNIETSGSKPPSLTKQKRKEEPEPGKHRNDLGEEKKDCRFLFATSKGEIRAPEGHEQESKGDY